MDVVNTGTVSQKAKREATNGVYLHVSARNGDNKIEVENAVSAPKEKFNMPSRPCIEHLKDLDVYSKLRGIDFPAIDPDEVTILIGMDVPEAQRHLEEVLGGKGQPMAVRTPFGWTLGGPSARVDKGVHCGLVRASAEALNSSVESWWEDNEEPPTVRINTVLTKTDEELHDGMEAFWQQEHCGILPQKEI